MTQKINPSRLLPIAMETIQRSWIVSGLCVALLASTAWADRPEGAGQGKHRREQETVRQGYGSDEAGGARQARLGAYFEPSHHQAVRDVYGPAISQGRCPPGLAKKGNGCLPPGQAKRWVIGQPLPTDVVLYPVPPALQVRLGTPPAGYKYVRAASDILLIAIGTSMVMDAIEDLGAR